MSEAGGEEEREAAFQRSLALQREHRHAEAFELLQPLTRPHLTVKVAVSLGVSLNELGRFDEGRHWLALAARHRPDDPELRRLLGNLLAETDRTDLAEREYRTALSLDPEHARTRLALGALLLSLGRYSEGWPLIEDRTKLDPDSIPPVTVGYPQWQGQSLEGRSILIWYEQGLGDQIQMCRFTQTLKARGAARVALGCRPQLVDLLATAPGVDEVIAVTMGGAVTVGRYDYWSRYFSLPGPLGITLDNLPAEPYLFARADRRERWRGFKGVGIAWKASPTGFNPQNKGLPDALAARLLAMGAQSLDPADTGVADFADSAAIIEQLDLVISIDTSVAHLAGAMGKPCWTLLPRVHTDWRWLRDRTDSPWYPSMRLYRQREAGRWDEVVDAVARDLEAFG